MQSNFRAHFGRGRDYATWCENGARRRQALRTLHCDDAATEEVNAGQRGRVEYKKAPDLAAALCDQTRGRRSQAWEEAKPDLLTNIQAKFRPIFGGWRRRVGGLDQARVIEYLIGDDMRLFLLRALPAMWTQLG